MSDLLGGLYVEIQARDAAYNAQMDEAKAAASEAGASIAHSFADAGEAARFALASAATDAREAIGDVPAGSDDAMDHLVAVVEDAMADLIAVVEDAMRQLPVQADRAADGLEEAFVGAADAAEDAAEEAADAVPREIRKGTDQALSETRGRLSGWGVAVGTAVGHLAAQAIASAGSAIAGAFRTGIQGAVDLQETRSKVEAIFGPAADTIISQADEMAAKYGVVKQSFLDAASSFGGSFKSAGMSAQAAADIGNQMAKLGMDMASFGNATNEEVFTALNAALRGEMDPLERFNVMFQQAHVNARAVAMGLAEDENHVSELAKKQATLNLIMEKTVDQQGDLERTADGSANQWRRLAGVLTNAAVDLGGRLEPALNAVLQAGNAMVDQLAPAIEWLGGMFTWFADGVVEAVATIGVMWRNLGSVWEIVQIQARQMFENTAIGAQTLAENTGRIAAWIGRNWYELIADGFNATAAVFQNFGENLGNLAYAVFQFLSDPTGGFNFEWKPLLEGFEATVSELPKLAEPAWVDMGEQINDVLEDVGRREVERNRAIAESKKVGAIAAARSAGAASAAKADFKSDVLSAADYAFKLRANILGGDDTAKKHLTAAQQTEKNTAKIAEAADRRPGAVFA